MPLPDRRSTRRRMGAAVTLAAILCLTGWRGDEPARIRFAPDDPLWVDADMVADAGRVKEQELSQSYDFLENTFTLKGDRRDIRALNVNTLDEVPDSSWFKNRIAHRPLSD